MVDAGPEPTYAEKMRVAPLGVGRGDTQIFSYIRRLGSFFGVHNSEFQYFLGFSEKYIFFGV